jgi:hypothetical protein
MSGSTIVNLELDSVLLFSLINKPLKELLPMSQQGKLFNGLLKDQFVPIASQPYSAAH